MAVGDSMRSLTVMFVGICLFVCIAGWLVSRDVSCEADRPINNESRAHHGP